MNLSRCKHCGAIAHYAKSVTDPHLCWSIQCSDCGISTPSYSQQEMAAAAWERTAAAQKYGHRNGETEAPTVDGVYWFKGECHHQTGTHRDSCTTISSSGTLLLFKNDITDARIPVIVRYGTYCWICGNLVTPTGQWWGPITLPWEQ